MQCGTSVGLSWAMKLDAVSCATLKRADQIKRSKTVHDTIRHNFDPVSRGQKDQFCKFSFGQYFYRL